MDMYQAIIKDLDKYVNEIEMQLTSDEQELFDKLNEVRKACHKKDAIINRLENKIARLSKEYNKQCKSFAKMRL